MHCKKIHDLGWRAFPPFQWPIIYPFNRLFWTTYSFLSRKSLQTSMFETFDGLVYSNSYQDYRGRLGHFVPQRRSYLSIWPSIYHRDFQCYVFHSMCGYRYHEEFGNRLEYIPRYAPISNSHAEMIVGTINRSLKKMIIGDGRDLEGALPDVLLLQSSIG